MSLREMQIKTAMRYHLPPVGTAHIRIAGNSQCWQGFSEKALPHCWWERQPVQLPREAAWKLLKKKKKSRTGCDPAIPLFGIDPQEHKNIHSEGPMHTSVHHCTRYGHDLTSGRGDGEAVGYIHNETLGHSQKEQTRACAAVQRELEHRAMWRRQEERDRHKGLSHVGPEDSWCRSRKGPKATSWGTDPTAELGSEGGLQGGRGQGAGFPGQERYTGDGCGTGIRQ